MIRLLLIILLGLTTSCSSNPSNQSASVDEKQPVRTVTVDRFERQRISMVEAQLKERDIVDPKVLKVMTEVPRHLFVKKTLWNHAYKDFPLPIEEGQTISQPYVVAFMTQVLQLTGSEKVLEIGTGSGYQAAILSKVAKDIYTIEIRPKLAESAVQKLKELKFLNVTVKSADGYFGWKEFAPFDAIMITAAVNHVPPPLMKQLKTGGKLILPLGSTDFFQTLTMITKGQKGEPPTVEHLMGVRFVPLVGKAEEEK